MRKVGIWHDLSHMLAVLRRGSHEMSRTDKIIAHSLSVSLEQHLGMFWLAISLVVGQ